MPLLEIENLRVSFMSEGTELCAVDGVSLSVERGETVGLVGESGCGKSVSALSVMRLLPEPPARVGPGRVLFDGVDLLALDAEEIRALRGERIAMIFQEPMTSLNPVFTIGCQVAEAIRLHRPGYSTGQVREKVAGLFALVGLPDPERRFVEYPNQLSGGMRQRVMIAMALSCEPDLLIADEPTTALDVTVQAQILELLDALKERLGMGILLITHDMGVVAERAARVYVMYAGRIVEESRAGELFAEPLHPYTQGLLASIPTARSEGRRRLKAIPGLVPSLRDIPAGCRFRDRCPLATPKCLEEPPLLDEKCPGRRVRCWEAAPDHGRIDE